MLHEGRQGHVEWPGQFADARRAISQPPQDGPARGIGKRLEDVVQSLLILFHQAKYRAATLSARANQDKSNDAAGGAGEKPKKQLERPTP